MNTVLSRVATATPSALPLLLPVSYLSAGFSPARHFTSSQPYRPVARPIYCPFSLHNASSSSSSSASNLLSTRSLVTFSPSHSNASFWSNSLSPTYHQPTQATVMGSLTYYMPVRFATKKAGGSSAKQKSRPDGRRLGIKVVSLLDPFFIYIYLLFSHPIAYSLNFFSFFLSLYVYSFS